MSMILLRKWWSEWKAAVWFGLKWWGVMLLCIVSFTAGEVYSRRQGAPPQPPMHMARPYFYPTYTLPEDVRPDAMTLTVKNNDVPVKNLLSQIVVIDPRIDATHAPLASDRFFSANDIAPGALSNMYVYLDVPPSLAFVAVDLHYMDAFTYQYYRQMFFLKYLGSPDGKARPRFVSVSLEQRAQMEQYLRDRQIPPLPEE